MIIQDDYFKQVNSVAILGGTFNPVHNGHLMMAQTVKEQLPDICSVVFMPNNMPAYKDVKDIISNADRVAMLQNALMDYDYANISLLELERGGITYTIDTLLYLHKLNSNLKIYFVIGADSLFSFDKWYCFEQILSECSLAVLARDCDTIAMLEKIEQLKKCYHDADILILKNKMVPISSSKIRSCIRNGESVREFLPNAVADYIMKEQLYAKV